MRGERSFYLVKQDGFLFKLGPLNNVQFAKKRRELIHYQDRRARKKNKREKVTEVQEKQKLPHVRFHKELRAI